jgi:hypothetical protein
VETRKTGLAEKPSPLSLLVVREAGSPGRPDLPPGGKSLQTVRRYVWKGSCNGRAETLPTFSPAFSERPSLRRPAEAPSAREERPPSGGRGGVRLPRRPNGTSTRRTVRLRILVTLDSLLTISSTFNLFFKVLFTFQSLYFFAIGGKLSALLRLHIRPIYLVVFQEPTPRRAGDLILRRASRLYAFSVYPGRTLATQPCR